MVIKVHTVQTNRNEQNNLQSFDKARELILFINIHSSGAWKGKKKNKSDRVKNLTVLDLTKSFNAQNERFIGVQTSIYRSILFLPRAFKDLLLILKYKKNSSTDKQFTLPRFEKEVKSLITLLLYKISIHQFFVKRTLTILRVFFLRKLKDRISCKRQSCVSNTDSVNFYTANR